MNCKEGDLAVFVKSKAGNEGKIVTCLRLATEAELKVCGFRYERATWIVDRYVKTSRGKEYKFASDKNLRPIRGQSGADETLTWCDVPTR